MSPNDTLVVWGNGGFGPTLKTPKFDRLKYQITKQLYSMK
jgi:hypothetical protein